MSTVEYVIILVLLASVSIAAWRLFGERVKSALGLATQKLDLIQATEDNGAGLSGGELAPGEASASREQPSPGAVPPSPSGSGTAGAGSAAGSSGSGAAGTTAASPPAAAVTTGLGGNIDSLVSKSPSLAKDVQSLLAAGWTFQYGPANGGTYTDVDNKTIVLDANEQSNLSEAAISVSHESGHALNPNAEVQMSGLTRAEYVKQGTDAELKGEGAATLANARARDEILAAGGPDIGIAGGQSKKYDAIYQQYKAGKITRDQAEKQIAQAYGKGETTSNTNQNYSTYYKSYYEQAWDAAYPNKPKTFRAP
jgi:type VI secretion system secreted protein VgrG